VRHLCVRFALVFTWSWRAVFAAETEDPPLALEVVRNGFSTGQVGEFYSRDGKLFATPSELSQLGFVIPSALRGRTQPISLDALPSVTATLEMSRQRVMITASNSALQPILLDARPLPQPTVAVSSAETGAVVNYDLLGTKTRSSPETADIGLNGWIFSPFGSLSGNGAVRVAAGHRLGFTRLDTTYEYKQPDLAHAWRMGDIAASSLSWTRQVRLFGGQISSDFSTQPNRMATAAPVLTSSAASPSTVDVLIDGIRQYSRQVSPGPFQIRSLPVINGESEVTLRIQNELGQQTFFTLPLYSSSRLLATGLADYSAELGEVRQSYGAVRDAYRNIAAIGSLRYGVSDALTAELHGEFGATLREAGIGIVTPVGSVGILSMGTAVSTATNPGTHQRQISGASESISFSRQARGLSFVASASATSPGFRDVAAINGSPCPRLQASTSISRSLGRAGGVSLAYVIERGGPINPSMATGIALNAAGLGNTSIMTAGYTARLGGQWSLNASAFRDQKAPNFGFQLSISFAPFERTSADAALSFDRSTGLAKAIQVTRTATAPGDWGAAFVGQVGPSASATANGEYLTHWGRISARVANSGNEMIGQAELSGAMILMNGSMLWSDKVADSFALVRIDEVPGLRVTYENRPAGATNASGLLLVPYLSGGQPNMLAVEASEVPADVQLDVASQIVRPPSHAGVIVDFGAHRTRAALVELELAPHKPVPLGASASLAGREPVPIGYDGEAYITGLADQNLLTVTLPDGQQCVANFAYKPSAGDLPLIGPVPCRPIPH